ncbi:MAG: glutathione S-transferase family protein [Ectothiorhodospiraceae bacterium]|nr:glutathione S-transferase family protein [Ectothiorhodospiraceae bacterium]
MRAKAVEFEVDYINLREKPDWFLEISPHGKVPVLVVGGQPLFESNAIAEFLDEEVAPRLHPADPIKRARNRAWTDFVPDFAAAMSGIYYASDAESVARGLELARQRVGRVENAIATERANDGPYFNGPDLSLVDAAYAPFLQRFAMVESRLGSGLLEGFPLVSAWSETLLADPRVHGSVAETFEQEFVANLRRRSAHVASLFA